MANAAALAAAHPRVAGLQLGLGDLFAPFAIARTPANVHAAMFAVRMAAARAGIAAYDGAWPDVADDAGFLAEATLARALGFSGKSCIHPRQVALAHQVFSLDQEALVHAQRVVEAAAAAQARGHGAFLVDGRMVDAPYLARAAGAGGRGPQRSGGLRMSPRLPQSRPGRCAIRSVALVLLWLLCVSLPAAASNLVGLSTAHPAAARSERVRLEAAGDLLLALQAGHGDASRCQGVAPAALVPADRGGAGCKASPATGNRSGCSRLRRTATWR